MNLIFLGPPASGKGTQAKIISPSYNLTHVSTGDIFREALNNKTEVGLAAYNNYWGHGRLVPDDITNQLAFEHLSHLTTSFILDGYPRTVPQAVALDTYLQTKSRPIGHVIHFEVSDQIVTTRASTRKTCSGCGQIYGAVRPSKTINCDCCNSPLKIRPDDTPLLMIARLEEYHQKTAPLLNHYQPLITKLDASKSIEDVTLDLHEIINKK